MNAVLKLKPIPTKESVASLVASELPLHTRNTGSLFSGRTDGLMIGGASLLFLAVALCFVEPSASVNAISQIAFCLAFVVNWPHFLVSYQLLYLDNRSKLTTDPRFAWAAFVSPVLLIAGLGYLIATANTEYLGKSVNLMYLLVGWHYVKQIFGTTLVTSALHKFYFTPAEKWAFRGNMYALWSLSWVAQNLSSGRNVFYGISYATFGLPTWMLTGAYAVTGVTLVALVGVMLRKYVREGRVPPASSVISVAAIYAWFVPAISHPVFFYMIPFFHSMQYLLFVGALRRNKVRETTKAMGGVATRTAFLKDFYGYFIMAGVTGTLAFLTVPTLLDQHFNQAARGVGPTVFLFAFNIFINVHHYFIDHVIWRGTNPELREYIVKPSQVTA